MTLHSVRGADQVQDSRVSRSGRLATDQKAVQRRGPGRVVLGSKPQLATAKKTRELGYWRYRLNQPRIRSRRSMRRAGRPPRGGVWVFFGERTNSASGLPLRPRWTKN